jgi:hypothetical protein
MRFAQE